MMKYRDIEYTVLQGIERGVWKWSASVGGISIMGAAKGESEAVAGVETVIDQAVATKRPGLPRPRAGRIPPSRCRY